MTNALSGAFLTMKLKIKWRRRPLLKMVSQVINTLYASAVELNWGVIWMELLEMGKPI